MWLFYAVAGLIVLNWLLVVLLILSSPLGVLLDTSTSLREDAKTMTLAIPLLLIFVTVGNGLGVGICLFMAEIIKLAIHVQANTQLAASRLQQLTASKVT